MVSWKWWYFFAVGCPLHLPASLYVGSIPLQVQILITEFCSAVLVHETHWGLCRVEVDTWPSHSMTYEIYCKSKALYWFCGMDWKLTFISQNPLTCSLFIPNRALASGSFVPKSLVLISLYIPSWFFPIYVEWTDCCHYLAQSKGPVSLWAFKGS